MTEVVVTAGARKHAKLQSNRHQQTNTQLYTQANVYFLFNCNSLRKCVVYEQEAEVASFFLSIKWPYKFLFQPSLWPTKVAEINGIKTEN